MPRLLQDPRKPGQPTLVLYDIPDDKPRGKVMGACKDYGLARLQYSAYQGKLTRAARLELETRLEKLLGRFPGLITILQLDPQHLDEATVIQREGDEDA